MKAERLEKKWGVKAENRLVGNAGMVSGPVPSCRNWLVSELLWSCRGGEEELSG